MSELKFDEALKVRRRQKRDTRGLNTFYLCSILKTTQQQITFGELMIKQELRYKAGFLKYLNWCVERGFIFKWPGESNKTNYILSDKGRVLLQFIDVEEK